MLSLEIRTFTSASGKPEKSSIFVNLRNWIGYTFDVLDKIIDRFVDDESSLHVFVKDSFSKDGTDMKGGRWKISMEDFDKNIRPWTYH